jgi:transposase InsO family protein
MSIRGNCWDNAVAESFLVASRRKELKKEIYKTQ